VIFDWCFRQNDQPAYNTATASGAPVEEEYPSGRKVKNEFESDGDLLRVTSKKASGSVFAPYVSNFSYTASGGISQMRLGNGRWETAKFNTRLQVTELGLGSSATDAGVWKTQYEYGELDANGNVVASKNTGNIARQTLTVPGTSFVQSYRYDSLYRLTEAAETTGSATNWSQTWSYDRYGNRIGFAQDIAGNTNAPNPTVDPNTNRFNAGQGFGYDANGNVVSDIDPLSSLPRQFTFNGDNKQSEVKRDGVTIGRYFYDGEGKRVKKVTDTETTVFVYDAAGKLIGEYSTAIETAAPKVQYLTADHLGSTRINTDQNGTVTSRTDYLPYGEEITGFGGRSSNEAYSPDDIRKGFTGYESDAETGLEFAQARMYLSQSGRFTGADALNTVDVPKAGDPQRQNLYTYVRNNPHSFIDPTGMVIEIRNLSSDERKKWEEVVRLANLKDADGNYVHPELNRLYQKLENDSRTYFIDGSALGQATLGRFRVEKMSEDGRDFTEASITLNFDKIDKLTSSSPGDFDSSFKKYDGLFGRKDSPIRRLAEVFGHEAAHAEFAMAAPAFAVMLQKSIDGSQDRIRAWNKHYFDRKSLKKKERSTFRPPPDLIVSQVLNDGLIEATERYAQERQKILNAELQYKKK